MTWPVEPIPDEDDLYFHVHHQKIGYDEEGLPVLKESALTNTPETGPNKSCDWSEYSTPEATWALLGKQYRHGKTEFKNPDHFFVYSHSVSAWRTVHEKSKDFAEQTVNHDPIETTSEGVGSPNNRAHSIIIGDKKDKLRVVMARLAQWRVLPPASKAEMKLYRRELG